MKTVPLLTSGTSQAAVTEWANAEERTNRIHTGTTILARITTTAVRGNGRTVDPRKTKRTRATVRIIQAGDAGSIVHARRACADTRNCNAHKPELTCTRIFIKQDKLRTYTSCSSGQKTQEDRRR